MDRVRKHIWQIAGLVFLAMLVAIILFRANAPSRQRGQRVIQGPDRLYANGNIAAGQINVPAGEMVKFEFALNRRARLRGSFATKGLPDQVICLVITAAELEKMSTGASFSAIANTGSVPGGRIDRRMEPGEYYLVFDNRAGATEMVLRTVDFKIE